MSQQWGGTLGVVYIVYCLFPSLVYWNCVTPLPSPPPPPTPALISGRGGGGGGVINHVTSGIWGFL